MLFLNHFAILARHIVGRIKSTSKLFIRIVMLKIESREHPAAKKEYRRNLFFSSMIPSRQ